MFAFKEVISNKGFLFLLAFKLLAKDSADISGASLLSAFLLWLSLYLLSTFHMCLRLALPELKKTVLNSAGIVLKLSCTSIQRPAALVSFYHRAGLMTLHRTIAALLNLTLSGFTFNSRMSVCFLSRATCRKV